MDIRMLSSIFPGIGQIGKQMGSGSSHRPRSELEKAGAAERGGYSRVKWTLLSFMHEEVNSRDGKTNPE